MIYLDIVSLYLTLPEAFDSLYANSASSYFLGGKVSLEVDYVRELMADEIGTYSSEIIFTSGATELNNIACKSILFGDDMPADKKHIITSQIEHKCIFSSSLDI